MALRQPAIKSAADLEGKSVGTAGIPYQSAYLKTILDKAGVDPGRVKEINVGFNLVARDAVQEGRRDAGRVLELRGRRAPAPRARSPSILGWTSSASRPTTSSSSSPARQDLDERRRVAHAPLPAGRRARARRPLRDDPDVGVDALAGGRPRPRPRAAGGRRARRRCRSSSPRTTDRPGAGRTRPSGGLRAVDGENELLKQPPTRDVADQRVPAGRGRWTRRARGWSSGSAARAVASGGTPARPFQPP